MISAFDMPARQAMVYQLDAAEDLPNAVALNSSMINAARIAGPGLAGLVIAKLGEGACFLINALSYLAVILALLGMNSLKERSLPPSNSRSRTPWQKAFVIPSRRRRSAIFCCCLA